MDDEAMSAMEGYVKHTIKMVPAAPHVLDPETPKEIKAIIDFYTAGILPPGLSSSLLEKLVAYVRSEREKCYKDCETPLKYIDFHTQDVRKDCFELSFGGSSVLTRLRVPHSAEPSPIDRRSPLFHSKDNEE